METLESESNQVESPKWHKKLLETRIEKMKNGQAEFISIDDLRKIWNIKNIISLKDVSQDLKNSKRVSTKQSFGLGRYSLV